MSVELKEMVEEAKTRMVILGMRPDIISDFEKVFCVYPSKNRET